MSSVDAFRDYQLNKAWVWEHQALTRARFVAGDARIGNTFEQIRIIVLTQPRDPEKLKKEVLQMREKMRASHRAKTNNFDIKNGFGGIVDVEFLVQYFVLAHANQYPQLTENIGNIALLSLLALLNIIDADLAKKVSIAYYEYRRLQHAMKLQGVSDLNVAASLVSAYVKAVSTLWKQTLLV